MSWKSNLRKNLEAMKWLYSKVDETMEKAAKKYNAPCKSGCYDCCHQLVTMTLAEGVCIIDGIYRSLPRGGSLKSVLNPILKESSNQFKLLVEDPGMNVERWFSKKTRCVLLDSEGRCRVYENRPVACRSHMVTEGSDCSVNSIGAMNPHVNNHDMIQASLEAGRRFSDAINIPLGYAPLPAALVWASILYLESRDGLMRKLKGTVFEDDKAGMSFWVLKLKTMQEIQ